MPKSKEFIDSSDEASGSDEEYRPKKKKKVESDDDYSSEEEKPKPKKKKPSKDSSRKEKKSSKGDGGSTVTGESGETMYQIANLRYASVSEFRGKTYVNIREYYYDGNGDLKPTRKGISLNAEQWASLKGHIADIDADLKKR